MRFLSSDALTEPVQNWFRETSLSQTWVQRCHRCLLLGGWLSRACSVPISVVTVLRLTHSSAPVDPGPSLQLVLTVLMLCCKAPAHVDPQLDLTAKLLSSPQHSHCSHPVHPSQFNLEDSPGSGSQPQDELLCSPMPMSPPGCCVTWVIDMAELVDAAATQE